MPKRLLFSLVLTILLTGCAPSRDGIVAVTALLDAAQTQSQTRTPSRTETLTAISGGGFGALVAAADSAPATPTPTPRNDNLPAGNARDIAQATDVAFQAAPRTRLVFNDSPVPMTFDEFYDGYNLRTGLQLSDKLLSLDGQSIVIDGYMAPPLKADLDYFVLTRVRLAFCPFCSTTTDWPDDIALVYLTDGTILASDAPLRVTGILEVGPSVDRETGMVSLVRIYADKAERLP